MVLCVFRVVQQPQKLNFMGSGTQLDNVTKPINASGFDRGTVVNRLQILKRPL